MEKQELIKKIQQFEKTFKEISKELEKILSKDQLVHLIQDLPHFDDDVSDFEFITRRALEKLIEEEKLNEEI